MSTTDLGAPISPRSYIYRMWLLVQAFQTLRSTLASAWGYTLTTFRVVRNITHLTLCWSIIQWLSLPTTPLVRPVEDGVKEPFSSPNTTLFCFLDLVRSNLFILLLSIVEMSSK